VVLDDHLGGHGLGLIDGNTSRHLEFQ